MPQFTYSATDTSGNVVEGTLAANDMMVAADQVRRMGYTPVRVEMADGAVPAARPLSLVGTNEHTVLTPNTEHRTPNTEHPPAHRPPVLDLTADYVEAAPGVGTLNPLSAPPLDSYGPLTTAEGRTLEPWERSVAAHAATAQELTATVAETSQVVAPVEGTNANAMHAAPQTGVSVKGREGVRIPYGAGVVHEKSTWQRFLEICWYPIFSGVVLKDMAPYLRQFATLINAGLPLYQALVALESNTPNKTLKEITREGQRQVQAGGKFSDVMAAYPWIFQPMQIAMIRAAEQGGMLDQVLRQVADYIDHDLEIRRIISRETIYPKITLFMAVMILGRPGFTSGLPAVSQLVLGGMGKEAYTFASYLMDTVGFGLLAAIPLIALTIACRLFLFNIPGVREAYDSFKMAIPSLGKITQMFATAKFARTYAALYRGGFSVGSALSIAGDACGNGLLRRAALRAIPEAERGGLMSDALARSNAFPHMAIDMMRTGETSGAMDQMLDRLADFYEAEGKQKSHQAALILGVVVFLLVALLVGKSIIEQWTQMGARSTTLPGEGASGE